MTNGERQKVRGTKRMRLNDPKNWRERNRPLTPAEINMARRVCDAARPA